MVLDCLLEVGFLGILGGMVVRAILVGACTIVFRGGRVYFAQDYMCRVLQDLGNCGICLFVCLFVCCYKTSKSSLRLPPWARGEPP